MAAWGESKLDDSERASTLYVRSFELGVVALPSLGRVLAAVAGAAPSIHGSDGDWPRAFASGHAEQREPRLRLAVSRSHTPEWVQRFASGLGGAELVPNGSVGFKVALLLAGKADLYVHQKGLKEWDTCAPEVIARAAGWSVCRFDGTAQRYNLPDPRNDQIVVCRPSLRERVLAQLAACAPQG
jgi:3'(2'), 5'-bisphosphate nucleotidase